MSPAFKRRSLMNAMGRVEDPEYLQKTGLAEQKRRVKESMENAEAAVAKMDAEEASLAQSYLDEAVADVNILDKKEKDEVKNYDEFWTPAELDEMEYWLHSIEEMN